MLAGYAVPAVAANVYSTLDMLSIAIADFDADGWNDFITVSFVPTSSGAVYACNNLGMGSGTVTFTCRSLSSTISWMMLQYAFASAADLNSDGR